jgi:hypothetical protein
MPSLRIQPSPRNDQREGKGMVIYYRGKQALITHEVFEVRCPEPQRFAIAELRDVHVLRNGVDPFAIRTMHLAGATAAAGIFVLPFLPTAAAWLTDLMIVVIPSLVVVLTVWRRNPPVYELRATYRGYVVRLFTSSDERTFGQVKRALLRSLEDYHAGEIDLPTGVT